jgi:2-polyprenyl-3-methyl-5-hydroxy-6-metoxy-1,4-benzoquinol methylase
VKFEERLLIDKEGGSELVHQHLARYEFAREFVPGKRVLDVACGTGYGAALLKRAGAASVLGVDISEQAIRYAREHYTTEDVSFSPGSADRLSPYGRFEVVVSFETIEHLERPDLFLEEVISVLEPTGTLIVSTPVREFGTLNDKPTNPFHVREWSADEFQILLRQYFQAVELHGQYSFKKLFPYSRTIQQMIFRKFFYDASREINNFPVVSIPPKYPGFRFEMIYMLAKCRRLIEQSTRRVPQM